MPNCTGYVIKQLVHAFSCALSRFGARLRILNLTARLCQLCYNANQRLSSYTERLEFKNAPRSSADLSANARLRKYPLVPLCAKTCVPGIAKYQWTCILCQKYQIYSSNQLHAILVRLRSWLHQEVGVTKLFSFSTQLFAFGLGFRFSVFCLDFVVNYYVTLLRNSCNI